MCLNNKRSNDLRDVAKLGLYVLNSLMFALFSLMYVLKIRL